MRLVNIDNLETELASLSDEKTLVLLSSEGCGHCDEMETYIDNLSESLSDIKYIRVNIDADSIPLFAPPVVPSIIGFEQSQRVLEGSGIPEDLSMVDSLLSAWIADEQVQYSAG